MVASVQTSSKGINWIAEDTVAPIQLEVTITNDHMVIIRAKGSTQQPLRKNLLRAAAYDTVRKRNVLPLQEIKRETMMIHQQRKIKLWDKDASTRINLISTSGIYLIAAKVAQCRQVAANRREIDEAKNITAKKTATRKFLLRVKRSEAFDMCINSMNSLSSSATNEYRLIKLLRQSPNTIKDAFVHLGGKLAELPNTQRDTVSREIIRILKWRSNPEWRANIIMSPCHPSPSSSCYPSLPPIYNPIIIPPLSPLCRSPSSLRCRLAEMQTIVVMGERSGASGYYYAL